jgi:hypothetical protein
LAIQELEPAFAGELPSHSPRSSWRTRLIRFLDRPAIVGLLALLGTLGFVLGRWQRWSHGHISSWILVGQTFAGPGLAPGIGLRTGTGYDGQFFYRLAMNPADLSNTAYGITFDAPYRLMRIGYPVLVWLASLGHGSLVPMMLVAVNVAAIVAMAVAGAQFARDGGYHALCGLLVAGYFGLLTSVSRDTAEPVACAFLLAGLLATRRRRPVIAGLLLAFGVLTRETVLVAVAAIAVVRLVTLLRHRQWPGRPDFAWLLPSIAFPAWELVCRFATGTVPLLADGDQNAGAPFVAAFDAIRNNAGQLSWTQFNSADNWLLELAVLVVVSALALCCWRRTQAPVHERLALVAYLVEICVVTPSTWNSLNADMRSFVEVYLMAIVILLSVPPVTRGVPRARRGWWLLATAAAWALPALYLTGMHRLVWSLTAVSPRDIRQDVVVPHLDRVRPELVEHVGGAEVLLDERRRCPVREVTGLAVQHDEVRVMRGRVVPFLVGHPQVAPHGELVEGAHVDLAAAVDGDAAGLPVAAEAIGQVVLL